MTPGLFGWPESGTGRDVLPVAPPQRGAASVPSAGAGPTAGPGPGRTPTASCRASGRRTPSCSVAGSPGTSPPTPGWPGRSRRGGCAGPRCTLRPVVDWRRVLASEIRRGLHRAAGAGRLHLRPPLPAGPAAGRRHLPGHVPPCARTGGGGRHVRLHDRGRSGRPPWPRWTASSAAPVWPPGGCPFWPVTPQVGAITRAARASDVVLVGRWRHRHGRRHRGRGPVATPTPGHRGAHRR